MKEKIAPTYKPVPYKGHVMKDGGHAKISTPRKLVKENIWAGRAATNKIMK